MSKQTPTMRPNAVFLILTLVAALVASIGMARAQTEILTFDDLPFTARFDQIPNGYGGLQWDTFDALNTALEFSQFGFDGYVNGVVSPNNVAFNAGGSPAFFSGQAFNLNSAYLGAAWNDGLQVEVQGFVGTILTYDNTYTVNTLGSTLINFNYVGVNEVKFISSGGVPHGYPSGGAGTQLVMDNLSITLVPEPSTFALAGLAVIIPTMRRRTQRRK